jgi:hypothetical protein
MADFKDSNDVELVRKCCKEIVDAMETVTKKNGTYLDFKYSNYASKDQNPLRSIGEKNFAKLNEIAVKYDPKQVFQKLQNGGWLLSKA